jgi:hypothetical protein
LARVARSSSKAAQGTDWRALINIGEARLAGYCSILLAATYLIFALYYQLLPGHPRDVDSILKLAGASPGWFRFLYGTLAIVGLMGIAVVGPITRLAGDAAPAWIGWARRLAYVGFAVTIVQGVRMASLLPQLGALYHGCVKCTVSLAEQQAVARALYGSALIDPSYWIVFGAISLWTLAVALALINSARVPAPLPYVGVALAVVYWLLVYGIAAGNIGFFTFASIVGGVILGPLWYGWLGVLLTRER